MPQEQEYTDWGRILLRSNISTICNLSAGEMLVLLCISDYANAEGVAWPKQATIACATGMSVRGVRNALVRLVGIGLLKRKKVRKLYHYLLPEQAEIDHVIGEHSAGEGAEIGELTSPIQGNSLPVTGEQIAGDQGNSLPVRSICLEDDSEKPMNEKEGHPLNGNGKVNGNGHVNGALDRRVVLQDILYKGTASRAVLDAAHDELQRMGVLH